MVPYGTPPTPPVGPSFKPLRNTANTVILGALVKPTADWAREIKKFLPLSKVKL